MTDDNDPRIDAVTRVIYARDPARSYDNEFTPLSWEEGREMAPYHVYQCWEKACAYLAAADAVDPLRLGRT